MKNKHNNDGLSLVEILVAITIFAILGMIISSSLILTIQGTKKSEAIIRVRENINYSLSVIERNLRNANGIADCTNTDTSKITYYDQNGYLSSFSCINTGRTNSYIASGSSKLTSSSIAIDGCSFTCSSASSSAIPVVVVDVTVKDASLSGSQASQVTAESRIYLRN